jgi:hypothetical protein
MVAETFASDTGFLASSMTRPRIASAGVSSKSICCSMGAPPSTFCELLQMRDSPLDSADTS